MNPFPYPHFELTEEFKKLSKDLMDEVMKYLELGGEPGGIDIMMSIIHLSTKVVKYGIAQDHEIQCGLGAAAFMVWHAMERYHARMAPGQEWGEEDDSAGKLLIELVVMLTQEDYVKPITMERVRENFKISTQLGQNASLN
jgi:hypothetical protein